jgi:flagellar basal body P-ring formation protein FlgA
MTHHTARSALILTLLLAPAGALAQAWHPLEDVRASAERFITAQLGVPGDGSVMHVTAGQLDPRTRLAQCVQTLAGSLSPTTRIAMRTLVGVSCTQPRWTVYVPVTIETELSVLVLRRALPRGSAIGAEDVEVRRMRVPGLADTYIREPAQLENQHLKSATAPGTALAVDLLAADILVKRGQRVTLVARVGGLEVRAEGEAIADANAAGRVRVLNLNSRRIVEGQVETRDRVLVSL